jgi:hypothetical protein
MPALITEIVSFLVAVMKYLIKPRFILALGSEGSVYICLTPCFWAENQGGRVFGGGSCLPQWTSSREQERNWGPGITFRSTPPETYFLPPGPPPKKFPEPPKVVPPSGDQVSNT